MTTQKPIMPATSASIEDGNCRHGRFQRSTTCMHLTDCLEDVRCGRPEDDDLHDPLGSVGRHVFDSVPELPEDES